MRGLIFGIAGLLLLASPAFGQVDTLQLVEIGSIEAPAEITSLHVEDLDGDDLKEIILTTSTNIHVYNGITYEEIWTSPGLDRPGDLVFADINNDGFIDFSVRDGTNIYLYDPHHSQVIWASDPLDTTFSCYNIGYRNDDEWIDIAIAKSERYGDNADYDTAVVCLYDGPEFNNENSFRTPLISGSGPYVDSLEWVQSVDFAVISSEDSDVRSIIIWTYLGTSGRYGGFSSDGRLKIFDSMSFAQSFVDNSGYMIKLIISGPSMQKRLFALSSMGGWTGEYPLPTGYHYYYLKEYSFAALIDSYLLWSVVTGYPESWEGYVFEDILDIFQGPEICYSGALDEWHHEYAIKLFSTSGWNVVWSDSEYYPSIPPYIYKNPSISTNPLVISRRYYIGTSFLDTGSGEMVAYCPSYVHLQNCADFNLDGYDEIIRILDNSILIYHLQQSTHIMEEMSIPRPVFLSTNYPNPFNFSTTIEYSLPEAGHVNIEIFDLLGRKVATPVDEEQEAGTYQVVWDARDRSSGVYFYRITAGDFAETRRMVLLK